MPWYKLDYIIFPILYHIGPIMQNIHWATIYLEVHVQYKIKSGLKNKVTIIPPQKELRHRYCGTMDLSMSKRS